MIQFSLGFYLTIPGFEEYAVELLQFLVLPVYLLLDLRLFMVHLSRQQVHSLIQATYLVSKCGQNPISFCQEGGRVPPFLILTALNTDLNHLGDLFWHLQYLAPRT